MRRLLQHVLHAFTLADHPKPWSGPTGKYYLSDKVATLDYLSTCSLFSQKFVEALSELLGTSMVANIHDRTFYVSKNYIEEIKEHRIIRRGKDWILEEHWSAVWQSMLRARVVRDSQDAPISSYWVEPIYLAPGYRERFYEITEDEFAKRTKNVQFDKDGFPVETPPSEEVRRRAEGFLRRRYLFPPRNYDSDAGSIGERS